MAQALTSRDSPGKVVKAVRRHLRLTRRTGNEEAGKLADRVKEPTEKLKQVVKEAQGAADNVQDCFDDWESADRKLDRTVRSGARKSADWDEDHPGAATVALLFAKRSISEVTGAPREDEPDLIAEMVKRGEGLPEGHPAVPLLAVLADQAGASRAAHRAWIDAGQKAVAADAAVDIARLAVSKRYKDNIIDIGRAAGEDVAEDCFPTLRRAPTVAEEEDGAAAEGGTGAR